MRPAPQLSVVTADPADDHDPLSMLSRSFVRHLEAVNASPNTIIGYREAVRQLAAFLARERRPLDPTRIRRADVEAFIRHLLTTARTAAGQPPRSDCFA